MQLVCQLSDGIVVELGPERLEGLRFEDKTGCIIGDVQYPPIGPNRAVGGLTPIAGGQRAGGMSTCVA